MANSPPSWIDIGTQSLQSGSVPTALVSLPVRKIKTARLWDADTAKQIGILHGHPAAVQRLAFSPDSTYDHDVIGTYPPNLVERWARTDIGPRRARG